MIFRRRKLTTWSRSLLAVGTLLALSLAGASSAAADQGAAPSATTVGTAGAGSYVIFNRPGPGGRADYRIQQDLARLVNETPAGETIYGAMFTFTQTPVAQALADAQARGVHVRLAIDSQGDGGANANPDNAAQQILKAAHLDQLVYCSGPNDSSSCISTRGRINHNKLFMFSKTGNMTDAVWVASYNLTKTQGRLFNNAVVHYGRPGLYHEFQLHMQHMLAQDKNNDYYNSDAGTYQTPDDQVEVYMSPRADSHGGTDSEAATDTVAQILSKITTYEKGCHLDVTQAQFTGPRRPVAEELMRIAELGCPVRIAYGSNLSEYTYGVIHGAPGIRMRGFYDGSDPKNTVSIHSKIITIHANVDGRHQDMVLSGSQNLTGPGLRMNDEILLVSKEPSIARAFDANFRTLWRRATCINVPSDVVCNHDA